jgi:hypothetical protein
MFKDIADGFVWLNHRGNMIGKDSISALKLASYVSIDVSENLSWQQFIEQPKVD